MSSGTGDHDQDYLELVFLYALQALPASQISSVGAHLSACVECRQELETLRPVIGAFASWPTDILRPSTSLWDRLARRIAADTGQAPVVPTLQPRAEQEWEEAAPGLSYKVLAADAENDRVSLLVRLAPGAQYPPHRHGGVEEFICCTASCGSTTRSSIPGITAGRRPAAPISVSGARPAARAFF
jgi:anti-sigma factor ChrR (cupin superfamily)